MDDIPRGNPESCDRADVPTSVITPTWLGRSSLEVAPDLIGCTLVRRLETSEIIRGLIVETEAYTPGDPACHAYRRRTPRNAPMFGPAGTCYVYLIYGIYHCLNVVTDLVEVPSAVLIRALQLVEIPERLQQPSPRKLARLAAGPGKLCQVLEIDRSLNSMPLAATQSLWLEHRSSEFQPDLVQTTRIGLTQGVDLPWRWYLAHCPAVSRL